MAISERIAVMPVREVEHPAVVTDTAGCGCGAGYGGRFIIQEKPAYARIHDWMVKRGVITMFLMSTFPNPLFDVAGLAAGAVQMPMRSFFVSVLGGKVIKNTWLAAAGGFGVGLFAKIL